MGINEIKGINLLIRRRLGRRERDYSFTRSSLVKIKSSPKSDLGKFPHVGYEGSFNYTKGNPWYNYTNKNVEKLFILHFLPRQN